MSQRIVSYAARNAFTEPPRVIALAAGVAAEIYPDQRQTRGEIAARYMQNLTGGRLYVSFNLSAADGSGGPVCDATGMFHLTFEDGQLLDLLPSRERVCAFSPTGGNVSTRLIYRNDLSHSIKVP